eukprot:TRINITY_DN4785_c0_g1_i1.p1 TRINITY_DN4785_c0_g1~~TRINITY_DN4785_c0_g1_i1.p1  ORF type:complete len:205 (-),score=36.31 TRINITY_DN4785_c0_g1_i1:21-584(-)
METVVNVIQKYEEKGLEIDEITAKIAQQKIVNNKKNENQQELNTVLKLIQEQQDEGLDIDEITNYLLKEENKQLKQSSRKKEISLTHLWQCEDMQISPIIISKSTPKGAAQLGSETLQKLAGKEGTALEALSIIDPFNPLLVMKNEKINFVNFKSENSFENQILNLYQNWNESRMAQFTKQFNLDMS